MSTVACRMRLRWQERERAMILPDSLVWRSDLAEDDGPQAEEDNSSFGARCLEGVLMTRKGRATGVGSLRWKRRYVELHYAKGGYVKIYEDPLPTTDRQQPNSRLFAFVPCDLEWVAKDVHSTTTTFAIEIPTDGACSITSIQTDTISVEEQLPSVRHGGSTRDNDCSIIDDLESIAKDGLNHEIESAKRRRKPVRIYFKCLKGSNEKALWLDAFQDLRRLSADTRHTHGLRSTILNGVQVLTPHRGRARTRTHSVDQFRPSLLVEDFSLDEEDEVAARINQFCYGKPMKRNEGREFMAIPSYAYPHRWMTITELHQEMMLPSANFHDLRDPSRLTEEIGHLKVEVLQCVGLPRLDRASDTDAVAYLVCGSSAFCTDVIPDRTNPIWLRKAKRACVFPVYHGYARLYVGVFDDDGDNAKDDFAGRVVIDVARLRHNSTYDVLLPLRQSTHIYTRRKRGTVRLRFTFFVKSSKDIILSYIPKKVKITSPANSKPDVSTTIACANPKAFRNVAITVHGLHMRGRFTLSKLKAEIKETSLVIRFILATILKEIQDVKKWINPSISAFIFSAWMHCIYEAKFSLLLGYVGIYILLQFTRTYAVFAVERTKQEGFVPPTFEEMVGAIFKKQSVEPLEMHRLSSNGHQASSLSLGRMNSFGSKNSFKSGKKMRIRTHEPKGQWLFKCLGFLPWDERLSSKRNLHLEFPYADGDAYEKFGLVESLADIHPVQHDHTETPDGHDFFGPSKNISVEEIPPSLPGISTKSITSSFTSKIPPRLLGKSISGEAFGGIGFRNDNNDNDDYEDYDDDYEDTEANIQYRDSGASVQPSAAATKDELVVSKEQDVDWQGPGRSGKGEKLNDTLNHLSYKLQSLTLHSFNDHVYDVKNSDSVYFAQAKTVDRGSEQTKSKKKLEKKLDRLLNVNEYSIAHQPIINRVGLLIEPMVEGMYGFLCFFRAFYNVATWQDPYLTFLVYVAIMALTFVLFWLPWRPIMLLVGILFVGPQNWLIRVLRENGTLPPPKVRERKNEVKEEHPDNIFFGHKRFDGIKVPNPPPDPDPREVQYIVVPYNRAMYQRFYDWPPEQQYSTVEPVKDDKTLVKVTSSYKRMNSTSSSVKVTSSDKRMNSTSSSSSRVEMAPQDRNQSSRSHSIQSVGHSHRSEKISRFLRIQSLGRRPRSEKKSFPQLLSVHPE